MTLCVYLILQSSSSHNACCSISCMGCSSGVSKSISNCSVVASVVMSRDCNCCGFTKVNNVTFYVSTVMNFLPVCAAKHEQSNYKEQKHECGDPKIVTSPFRTCPGPVTVLRTSTAALIATVVTILGSFTSVALIVIFHIFSFVFFSIHFLCISTFSVLVSTQVKPQINNFIFQILKCHPFGDQTTMFSLSCIIFSVSTFVKTFQRTNFNVFSLL